MSCTHQGLQALKDAFQHGFCGVGLQAAGLRLPPERLKHIALALQAQGCPSAQCVLRLSRASSASHANNASRSALSHMVHRSGGISPDVEVHGQLCSLSRLCAALEPAGYLQLQRSSDN